MIHFLGGYVEPPKLHEGLTHLFTKTEKFTPSTTEIVVPSSQTTLYDNVQMYMYLRGGSRPFHKGNPFYFRNHFFLKKYQKIPMRNSNRKLQENGKKKNDKHETGYILLKYVFISL